MKIKITELRNMVAEAVRRTLENHASKEVSAMTDEAEQERRERQVRSLPGYHHSDENDFSKPLGPNNIVKKQGASNMGGWTAEAIIRRKIKEMQLRKLVRMIVGGEVRASRGRR